jgi:hypothetical protein
MSHRLSALSKNVVTSREASVAQLLMQDAKEDHFRAVKYWSPDRLRQSSHFCFSLTHLAFARRHCFDVHLKTLSIADDVEGIMQDARNDQFFRPVRWRSSDRFWQSDHLSLSFSHSDFARFHGVDVRW